MVSHFLAESHALRFMNDFHATNEQQDCCVQIVKNQLCGYSRNSLIFQGLTDAFGA
jgi:hypothetical protein